MKRRESLSLLLLPLLGAQGCSKPKPPTLQPRSVRFIGATRYTIELAVQLDAHNPNAFPLDVSAVTAKVELPAGASLGTARSANPFTLPPRGDQVLDVKLSVELDSFQALVPYAFKLKPAPYTLNGVASVRSADFTADVPFRIEGELTLNQLMQTGLREAGISGPK